MWVRPLPAELGRSKGLKPSTSIRRLGLHVAWARGVLHCSVGDVAFAVYVGTGVGAPRLLLTAFDGALIDAAVACLEQCEGWGAQGLAGRDDGVAHTCTSKGSSK
mgnify:CR=1 FL=1